MHQNTDPSVKRTAAGGPARSASASSKTGQHGARPEEKLTRDPPRDVTQVPPPPPDAPDRLPPTLFASDRPRPAAVDVLSILADTDELRRDSLSMRPGRPPVPLLRILWVEVLCPRRRDQRGSTSAFPRAGLVHFACIALVLLFGRKGRRRALVGPVRWDERVLVWTLSSSHGWSPRFFVIAHARLCRCNTTYNKEGEGKREREGSAKCGKGKARAAGRRMYDDGTRTSINSTRPLPRLAPAPPGRTNARQASETSRDRCPGRFDLVRLCDASRGTLPRRGQLALALALAVARVESSYQLTRWYLGDPVED